MKKHFAIALISAMATSVACADMLENNRIELAANGVSGPNASGDTQTTVVDTGGSLKMAPMDSIPQPGKESSKSKKQPGSSVNVQPQFPEGMHQQQQQQQGQPFNGQADGEPGAYGMPPGQEVQPPGQGMQPPGQEMQHPGQEMQSQPQPFDGQAHGEPDKSGMQPEQNKQMMPPEQYNQQMPPQDGDMMQNNPG